MTTLQHGGVEAQALWPFRKSETHHLHSLTSPTILPSTLTLSTHVPAQTTVNATNTHASPEVGTLPQTTRSDDNYVACDTTTCCVDTVQ